MLEAIATILGALGITSAVAALSLWLAFINLLPEIVIDSVVQRSKTFNATAQFNIRNAGKLAAHSIQAYTMDAYFEWNTNTFDAMSSGPNTVAAKLVSGECANTSITPGMKFEGFASVDKYAYTLLLEYEARLLFLKKKLSRCWQVELRHFPDGYDWETTVLDCKAQTAT